MVEMERMNSPSNSENAVKIMFEWKDWIEQTNV